MVLRAYPEEIATRKVQVKEVPPQNQQVVYYVQDETWQWIIKALVVVGAIIILAYVAKKLFEK